jgi:hypothetical protein
MLRGLQGGATITREYDIFLIIFYSQNACQSQANNESKIQLF